MAPCPLHGSAELGVQLCRGGCFADTLVCEPGTAQNNRVGTAALKHDR